MYNDQPPVKNEKMNWKNAHRPRGHSKGVTAFDNETGFWIISSVPRFPTVASEGYQFMANQTRFGQTILCITFRSENVKKEINIYDEIMAKKIGDLLVRTWRPHLFNTNQQGFKLAEIKYQK
ncbi:plancitoxin-1-like [Crassostrea virginica]